MKLIKQKAEILTPINRDEIMKGIEIAGRVCYKSESRITEDSSSKFVKMILKRGHESVIEHKSVTVKFTTDRGVTHAIVRHRLSSFSQESTIFVNYKKKGLQFIIPSWVEDIPEGEYEIDTGTIFSSCATDPTKEDSPESTWFWNMAMAERDYLRLLEKGWKPMHARTVLPISMKTELVVTANLRQWRLIFKQRTDKVDHPQTVELFRSLLKTFKEELPEIFDSIELN